MFLNLNTDVLFGLLQLFYTLPYLLQQTLPLFLTSHTFSDVLNGEEDQFCDAAIIQNRGGIDGQHPATGIREVVINPEVMD